jgi:hypothetical protein
MPVTVTGPTVTAIAESDSIWKLTGILTTWTTRYEMLILQYTRYIFNACHLGISQYEHFILGIY